MAPHLAAQPDAVEPSREARRMSAPLPSSAKTSASRPRPAAAITAVAPASFRELSAAVLSPHHSTNFIAWGYSVPRRLLSLFAG